MDTEIQSGERGYLGEYGVLIVPPGGQSGEWFVTLASWDGEGDLYSAGTQGPLFATREEAVQESDRIMEWLTTLEPGSDVPRLWDSMQQAIARQEGLEGDNPAIRLPWTI